MVFYQFYTYMYSSLIYFKTMVLIFFFIYSCVNITKLIFKNS